MILRQRTFILASPDHFCTVKGNTGDGKSRGSCEEDLVCLSDGSCKEPGR